MKKSKRWAVICIVWVTSFGLVTPQALAYGVISGTLESKYIWKYSAGVDYYRCTATVPWYMPYAVVTSAGSPVPRDLLESANGAQTGPPSCDKVGTVMVSARTALNGRQSQWRQEIQGTSGPDILPTHHWNCVDSNNTRTISIDTECNSGAGDWPKSSANPATHNNYHSDDSTYWYDFYYTWQVDTPDDPELASLTWYWPDEARDNPLMTFHFVCNQNTPDAAKCWYPGWHVD